MILLTGTSGFIGQHLHNAINKLYSPDEVVIYKSATGSTPSYLLHRGISLPICATSKLNITKVIHAGAYMPKSGDNAMDWKMNSGNITSTLELLTILPPSVNTFIFLSTVDVYDTHNNIINEESPVVPVSIYAHSKYYCERLLINWANEKNVISQILRVGHLYGPGEEAFQKLIPVTIKKCYLGISPEIWGDGTEVRTLLYVKDAVNGILNAINLKHSLGVINLVGNEPMNIVSIVENIIRVIDSKLQINYQASQKAKRDLFFNNAKMKQNILSSFTSFHHGITLEICQMKQFLNK
jgi:nucleoside-diphosphate-sugar epimerase